MDLKELYKGRENERITPIICSEVWNALGNTDWWIKVNGKCYAPAEIGRGYDIVQHNKIGDLQQVDPRKELARADRILADLQKRRDRFAERIEHFSKGNWY